MRLTIVITGVVLFSCATPLLAQPAGWTVEFSGGVAAPSNDIASRLSTGWSVDAGLGYDFTSWFAVLGEFGFTGMQVPADVLQQLAAPDGHGRIFSLTVDPQIRFPLTAHLQGFVAGGVGWIRRTVELTTPTTQFFDYYDPFYGDLGPQQVTTDQVLSSVTRNAFGGNVGGGVSLPLANTGADLFVDVRYYYAPTSPRVTAMVPVMFGIRWTASKTAP